MIDTLRLCGDAGYYRFSYDYDRFVGYRTKEGTERISEVLIENKKDKNGASMYRVFHSVARNTISVELNPHKLIFQNNIYNYEFNSAVLNSFIRDIASHFFNYGSCYISRVDLGGVNTFSNPKDACDALERYRGTRVDGTRLNAWKGQNYKDSVFYRHDDWSIKIYNKGKEMKLGDDISVVDGIDLLSTLRYEKTYRFRAMEKLGIDRVMSTLPPRPDAQKSSSYECGLWAEMRNKALKGAMNQSTPYKGVNIDSFDISLLVEDFFNVFRQWELQSTPYITEQRGSAGLLSVIDSMGRLAQIEGSGIVSKTTLWRYKKMKKQVVAVEPITDFKQNMSTDKQNVWYYARTFGLKSFLG